MAVITVPKANIPIGSVAVGGRVLDVVTNPEFVRLFDAILGRIGGVSGDGTDDLARSQFEDAGIEETKAALYAAADEFRAAQVSLAEVNARIDAVTEHFEAALSGIHELAARLEMLALAVDGMQQGTIQ